MATPDIHEATDNRKKKKLKQKTMNTTVTPVNVWCCRFGLVICLLFSFHLLPIFCRLVSVGCRHLWSRSLFTVFISSFFLFTVATIKMTAIKYSASDRQQEE